jgi:hypothetical protein
VYNPKIKKYITIVKQTVKDSNSQIYDMIAEEFAYKHENQ